MYSVDTPGSVPALPEDMTGIARTRHGGCGPQSRFYT
jgi:hypothetical protein